MTRIGKAKQLGTQVLMIALLENPKQISRLVEASCNHFIMIFVATTSHLAPGGDCRRSFSGDVAEFGEPRHTGFNVPTKRLG